MFVTTAALLLAACAADKPKPTPLETYPPKIAGRVVWEGQIGKVGFALVPAVKEGVFYLASGDGDVVAMQAETAAPALERHNTVPVSACIATTSPSPEAR